MGAPIDLTGKKFGKLTVIKLYPKRNKYKERIWECVCECGKKVKVLRRNLLGKYTQSCGCLRRRENNWNWQGYKDIPLDFYRDYKRGAYARNLEFKITIQDISNKLINQNYKCALSGIPIEFGNYGKDFKNKTISIDRIDNNKGYTKSNIQLVYKKINVMKNKLNEDEFFNLCKKIVQHQKL